MKEKIVVVGAGQAAAQLALSLRQEGWQGGIMIIGEEALLPYHRPPLSKSYLSGEMEAHELPIRPLEFYQKQDIDVKLNTSVVSIQRADKIVRTQQGESIPYTKLCLSTGTRARKLKGVEGEGLEGVYYLRTAQDLDNIKNNLQAPNKVVIIGGGYIGLETAASLTKKSCEVTILEAGDRVLQRVTSPVMSDFFSDLHRQNGVTIHTQITIERFLSEESKVRAVQLSDDRLIEADCVIIGVGVEVNDQLAKDAQLETNNGIVVNQYCQTKDPEIFSIGDCTWHYNPLYQCWLRLESVQNANDQAKIAAKAMVSKEDLSMYNYNSLPWFWSDQYNVKLQIAGLSNDYDDLKVEGDISTQDFNVSYYRQGKLIAVDAINQPRRFMQAKKAIIESLNGS
jgi:3-phenylpropionate/trans-cinnamate dioxygenase ferredoxin reductase subunit